MSKVSLLIGGDLVPTKTNYELFTNGDLDSLIGNELISILENSDFRIFNLEVPLTDKKEPIEKCGPNLIAPTNTMNGIKEIDPSLLGLANNHILDQGEQGLYSTIELLKSNEIPFVGAGKNINEAQKPYILEKNGIKVGVYTCAEHEFSIATETSAGANPFDVLESFDHIANLKKECDYVIVLYHGGKEHYRYPSPNLQKVCRKIAEKGADLVICQHSHCIGCLEEYNGSTIVYGQGNFLFDCSNSEFWQTSLLIKVIIDGKFNVEYSPIVKCENTARLADEKQREEILKAFIARSNEIKMSGFIETEYSKFASSMALSYKKTLIGDNLVIKICNKLFGQRLMNKWYSKKTFLRLYNYIQCEAHRELLIRLLRNERAKV